MGGRGIPAQSANANLLVTEAEGYSGRHMAQGDGMIMWRGIAKLGIDVQ